MSHVNKNKLHRLHLLYTLLQSKNVQLSLIEKIYIDHGYTISKRQIHRDLIDVQLFLKPTERLHSNYVGKEKFYEISEIDKKANCVENNSATYYQTHFYTPNFKEAHILNLNIIERAIQNCFAIQIDRLLNDETGDNYKFTNKKIKILPITVVSHRNSLFVGGFTITEKTVVFYSIRQLVCIKILPLKFDPKTYENTVFNNLENRFGITKNIDETTYSIKIEIASVLAHFIQEHNWHSSQKIEKLKGKSILTLTCGINRELIGWLLQWMYNIKIIEPQKLIDVYTKTLHEINAVAHSKKTLAYRNIFNENELDF